MTMTYNPDEATESVERAVAGTYDFTVDQLEELTFRSGNPGAKAVLRVQAFNDRDVKVYASFVYVPKALWKLRQFFECVGMDFKRPPPVEAFAGLKGRAEFITGEKGYLEVDNFLPAFPAKAPAVAPMGYQTPVTPPADDDVPF